MGASGTKLRWALVVLLACAVAIGGLTAYTEPGAAEDGDDAAKDVSSEVDTILKKMGTYLGGLGVFSVKADMANEILTTDGQKLQVCGFASILMKRPGNFRIARKGMHADAEFTYDGKLVTIFGKQRNAYFQIGIEGSTDDAFRRVEFETGLDLPGADLLFSSPYDVLAEGILKSEYIGTDFVGGVECHNLAFREGKVDWQLWVQTGDRPLPMKYVITSKWTTSAPQYTVILRDWNTTPEVAADAFSFTAPEGARKLDSLPVNLLGEIELPEEGR